MKLRNALRVRGCASVALASHGRVLVFALTMAGIGLANSAGEARSIPPGPDLPSSGCGRVPVTLVKTFRHPHRFRMIDGALLFRTHHLAVDLDGTPTAYGVRDQGIENICDGLASYTAPVTCRSDVNARGCRAACQAALQEWNERGRTGEAAKLLLCSVGVGSGCGPSFSYDLQPRTPPDPGYFVSSTSLHYEEPEGTPRKTWVRSQPAQLNAMTVPYLALSPQLRSIYGMRLGELGAVIRTDSPEQPPVFFVLGDGGTRTSPAEFSAYARKLLGSPTGLPTGPRISALGETVERVLPPPDLPVAIIIFPDTYILVAGTTRTVAANAASIDEMIETQGRRALQDFGGTTRLLSCAPRQF